jgi:hypothetical protein
MDEPIHVPPNDLPPVRSNEEDVQGNLYEFYLLLQKLKAGGISFDSFLERATTWAKLRAARNRQH